MKKSLFLVLAVVAMVGCNNENDVLPGNGDLKEIHLNAGITAQSRAAYNGDVAINALQFLRKDAAQTTNDFTGCTAITGDRAQGGTITFGNSQYYAASGNTYFASYYPEGQVSNNVVTWTIDGKTDILTAATIDAGTNASHTSVGKLSYLHQLAQIEVKCKAAADGGTVQTRWGDITSIKLKNTPATVTYAYNGLAVTPGALGDIELVASDYTASFAPIAIPASTNDVVNAAGMFYPLESQTFQLEVTTATEGTKVITIDLGAGNAFKRSQKHVVTLTFQPTATTDAISVSSTVEEWTTGATGEGSLN